MSSLLKGRDVWCRHIPNLDSRFPLKKVGKGKVKIAGCVYSEEGILALSDTYKFGNAYFSFREL